MLRLTCSVKAPADGVQYPWPAFTYNMNPPPVAEDYPLLVTHVFGKWLCYFTLTYLGYTTYVSLVIISKGSSFALKEVERNDFCFGSSEKSFPFIPSLDLPPVPFSLCLFPIPVRLSACPPVRLCGWSLNHRPYVALHPPEGERAD